MNAKWRALGLLLAGVLVPALGMSQGPYPSAVQPLPAPYQNIPGQLPPVPLPPAQFPGQPQPFPGQYPPQAPRPPVQPPTGQYPPTKVMPRLEPFAETKLLMEGLAQANFRGLERLLSQKPADDKAWTFARGQALILAETGNLLMMRPPRNEGEPIWFQRVAEYRSAAMTLAQSLGQKDYSRSRAGLHGLAKTCNNCHQSFRVPVQISPFEDQPKISY